jgi:hypothetical protein
MLKVNNCSDPNLLGGGVPATVCDKASERLKGTWPGADQVYNTSTKKHLRVNTKVSFDKG